MGGDNGETDNTIRFAPYLEAAHKDMLNDNGTDTLNISVFDAMNAAFNKSPYGGTTVLVPENAFFGLGYGISDFPSLYDMFGKFLAGLDIHNLWEQTYNGIINSAPLQAVISTHAQRLDDDLEQSVYPRFEAGMRNINAIHSTAFAVGRAIIEDTRIRELNSFIGKLELGAFETSIKMWGAHLDWNRSVVSIYSDFVQTYYGVTQIANEYNAAMSAKHTTFNLDIFDYGRSIIGALNGAPAAKGPGASARPSPLAKGISGAAAGAATGAYIGSAFSPVGTAIGAVIGGVIGFAAGYFL